MMTRILKIPVFILILLFPFSFASGQKISSEVKHPEWSYNKVIYEVNIRQFTPEGTFKAFEKHLPRLKDLGAGILWLMPIHPIGQLNRKGQLGSYYSVKDYFGINPEFGTMEDFKSLVRKVHEEGMYIIIDWVANHTSWDNELTVTHPEWFTKDSLGNFTSPIADWADVIDLNYDKPGLRDYMTDALKFWVKECGIDGYRGDVAGMVPTDFWDNARRELDQIKPVFMLAEWESPKMHAKAFDMTYSWELFNIFNSIAKGEKRAADLNQSLKKEGNEYPENAYRMRFTSNHDENSWNGTVFERLGSSAETFAVLSCVIPGMPLVYNGQEAGLDKRLKFFEKDPIEWKDHKFFNLYKKLFLLKRENLALLNGEKGGKLTFLSSETEENIFSFRREKEDDVIIAVFNLSPIPGSFELENVETGRFRDLFTNELVSLKENKKIDLEGWGYKIYAAE